jgi:hypothetical protein
VIAGTSPSRRRELTDTHRFGGRKTCNCNTYIVTRCCSWKAPCGGQHRVDGKITAPLDEARAILRRTNATPLVYWNGWPCRDGATSRIPSPPIRSMPPRLLWPKPPMAAPYCRAATTWAGGWNQYRLVPVFA